MNTKAFTAATHSAALSAAQKLTREVGVAGEVAKLLEPDGSFG